MGHLQLEAIHIVIYIFASSICPHTHLLLLLLYLPEYMSLVEKKTSYVPPLVYLLLSSDYYKAFSYEVYSIVFIPVGRGQTLMTSSRKLRGCVRRQHQNQLATHRACDGRMDGHGGWIGMRWLARKHR
jgi:hypothetical protein